MFRISADMKDPVSSSHDANPSAQGESSSAPRDNISHKERRLSGAVSAVGLFVAKGHNEEINTQGTEFPAGNTIAVGINEFIQSHLVIEWLNTKFESPDITADPINEHLVRILYRDRGVFDIYCLRVRYSEDGARSSLEECNLMSDEPTGDYASSKDILRQLPSAVSTNT